MIREQLDLFDTKYDLIDNKVDEFFCSYHAGMADGDGSFKFNKKSLCYQLSLIDKNIIKELSDLYGTKLGKVKKYKPHHRQAYVVSLSSKNAEHFYKKVYPYLIEKQAMDTEKEKFNRLQQEQRDLDASYRQSLKNKKEREAMEEQEDNEEYLKQLKDKL